MNLIAVSRCRRAIRTEKSLNREILDSLNTSDELGRFIGHDVEVIMKNREAIEQQQKSKTPNEKIVARAQENIATCTNTIKARLVNLSAKPDEIDAIIDSLNKCDYQTVTLEVLKMMARKNPGMHKKKYERALLAVRTANQNQR